MKKSLFLLLLMFSFYSFSQSNIKKDTNEICIPSKVIRQMTVELNELDKLKDLKKQTDFEIVELEKKIFKQDSLISKLEQKDINNQLIVVKVEEKYKLVEQDNKDLRSELKWVGIKTNIVEIVSGFLMASFVYIELFK